MDDDLIDLSLKHALKNWASRSPAPVDGKSRLINSALNAKKSFSKNRIAKLSGFVSMSLHENFIEIYLEIFKNTPQYSLQPGSMGLNFSHGLNAK
jgi:hypothetical protein